MRRATPIAVTALLFLALPTAARAQQHAASAETLDAIATSHAEHIDAGRAELEAFLARPEVRDIAESGGIDILTAQAAAATLSTSDIQRLSGPLAQADAALAGGDTVVISTTAIIIGLLILIVILVA
jgi:hypothetical protein